MSTHPSSFVSLNVISLTNLSKPNTLSIVIAIGIIVSLGGVFIILASYRVLPLGLNVISEIGIGGKILGYGMLSSGLLIIAISSIKEITSKKITPVENIVSKEVHDIKSISSEEVDEKNLFSATLLAQKIYRGKLARKKIQNFKQEKAAITLQNLFRRHLVFKRVENYLLSPSLTEEGKKYLDDPTKLKDLEKVRSRGVYISPSLPIVIRFCQDTRELDRFSQMSQARLLCEKMHLSHIAIPKARLQEPFILEEKLPGQRPPFQAMGLYYKNRQSYTNALKEFTTFLCHAYLGDLIGNNYHGLNFMVKEGQIPRFDNVLLFTTEKENQKIYKIGLVDIETFSLEPEIPSFSRIFSAMFTTIQLFPFHFDAILEAGKASWKGDIKEFEENLSSKIEDLKQATLTSQQFYKVAYLDVLSFYEKNNISIGHSFLVPVSSERKGALKKEISATVLNLNESGRNGYDVKNCLKGKSEEAIKRFEDEVFPKILEVIEKEFQDTLDFYKDRVFTCIEDVMEIRMISYAFTINLKDLLLKAYPKATAIIKKRCIDLIFEDTLHLLAKGGEIYYYKPYYHSISDSIFF